MFENESHAVVSNEQFDGRTYRFDVQPVIVSVELSGKFF